MFFLCMKVMLPLRDIDEIRRSQHAVINPAITIFLRTGAGGHGVPPLGCPDGRVRYKFASFWNRNHTFRALQRAMKNFHAMIEAEKQERAQSALRALSSSRKNSSKEINVPEDCADLTGQLQPFVKEEVLVSVFNGTFPCTAEQFFNNLLSDDSSYITEYRTARQDKDINLGQWHVADEYDGQVRELNCKSICHSPMCPPYSAMTEWQHMVLSANKTDLVCLSAKVNTQYDGKSFLNHSITLCYILLHPSRNIRCHYNQCTLILWDRVLQIINNTNFSLDTC
uniref:VASt domain-containing protein n=1 Tax=Aegilops tauschii subsp. strangulata TaxID=200361 RepID=A0A453LCE3_AEGTS